MHVNWPIPLLLSYLVLLGLVVPSAALVNNISIVDDSRHGFLINRFGLNEGGFIIINITQFKSAVGISQDSPDYGFLIHVKDRSDLAFDLKVKNQCILRSNSNKTFSYPITSKTQVIVHRATSSGYHHLFFENCRGNAITANMVLTEYNIGINGTKHYLSVGESSFPLIYLIFAILNLFLSVIWIGLTWRRRTVANAVHGLMMLLIVLKTFSLFSRSMENLYLKQFGEAEGWDIPYYIFTVAKTIMTFVVIGLIGAGYNFFKFYMSERDRKIFAVIIGLQILANIAQIEVWEGNLGSQKWRTWAIVLQVVDIICCLAVAFHISITKQHLAQAAETDGKAARIVTQLHLFRSFYVWVLAYLYFTRVLVVMLDMGLPFGLEWFSFTFKELVTFLFYVVIGYKFRPVENSPYFEKTSDEEDDEDDVEVVFELPELNHRGDKGENFGSVNTISDI